ncbi:hypothetical protein CDLVIII_0685 [Clostridium sp. DL-VIII]|uniref:hypothetical protein n=1 Tax=Clostridium sp. DL-VIII TaxID=641107 RepID=UPI00023AF714|nr:hypothetical protein [Clostridium sp. DL-VIII]EHI97411.1 hypothetical protein CDLVIII_0685 [Clostridium sp. DL-VIII]
MKNKMLTLALAALLVAGTAIPSMAKSIGEGDQGKHTYSLSGKYSGEYGLKKTFDDDTYGFSWIDTDNNSISEWSAVTIGDTSYPEKYGYGYAQASQRSQPGDQIVSEDHGIGQR